MSHSDYVSVAMEFRCDLACIHCMIGGIKKRLQPLPLGAFDQILAGNTGTNRRRGIVLTGAEITLRRDLPDLVRKAKNSNYEHVRIQTHGMHLCDTAYCDALLDAGVDEFFVSVAGSSALAHDAITGRHGSFDKMAKALDYLDDFDHLTLITNTVVTIRSYLDLTAIVGRFAHLKRLKQMEFWYYWSMHERDNGDLLPPLSAVIPHLREAIAACRRRGARVEVKNFPECLTAPFGDVLCNDQPQLHIDPSFWSEFERNGFHQCVYRDKCRSQQCLGLNAAYIRRYGWEPTLLHPLEADR
ncbi:MAG: radical SAM protein [Chitinivibrionales bacterium]|nr:radical SAM protein [Chitinivibrionales bacterium]MBD3358923.1 radical SAM protein [Chitinivibrionales bacterium]